MDQFTHFVVHAWEDTLPLVPFLLVTYLVLEVLEHTAGERVNAAVRRAGAAGPVVGGLLGIVPQCGFSAMGATLYAGRVITLGTLVGVFLSTSDEMLPMLVAERTEAGTLVSILAAKAAIAAVTGLVIDLLLRALRRSPRVHEAALRLARGKAADVDLIEEMASAGESAEHIHRLCEHDHCGCDDEDDYPHVQGHDEAHGGHGHDGHGHGDARGAHVEHGHGEHACATACGHGHAHDHAHSHGGMRSIVKSALSHTIQVSVFIFIVTLVLVAVLETVGEDALAGFLASNGALAVFASALVGLIPNCAASVVITQLYLEGVLGFGALMAGTLVSAGVGFLVLFRTNHNARENVIILVLLYVIAVVWGLLLG